MSTTIEATERDHLRGSIIKDQEKRAKEIAADLRAQARQKEEQSIEEQARAQAQAEAAESLRLSRIEELRARAQTELSGEELVAALSKFQEATEHFIRACKKYDERHSDILEPLINDESLKPLPRDILNQGFNAWRPTIGGREIRRARPQSDINKTVREIYQRHYPRHSFSLDNPQD
jgi:hypothetical protein